MGSYAELTSRGSFNDVTRPKRRRYREPEPRQPSRAQRLAAKAAALSEQAVHDDAAIQAWAEVRGRCKDQLTESTFGLWIEPLRLVGRYRSTLLLCGPAHVTRWVNRRYPELLAAGLPDGLRQVVAYPLNETEEEAW